MKRLLQKHRNAVFAKIIPYLCLSLLSVFICGKIRRSTLRITSKGQVTIPAKIRKRAGLLPHTEVDVDFDGTVVRVVRSKTPKADGRGARIVAHLRGRGYILMTTDEIMALTRED